MDVLNPDFREDRHQSSRSINRRKCFIYHFLNWMGPIDRESSLHRTDLSSGANLFGTSCRNLLGPAAFLKLISSINPWFHILISSGGSQYELLPHLSNNSIFLDFHGLLIFRVCIAWIKNPTDNNQNLELKYKQII